MEGLFNLRLCWDFAFIYFIEPDMALPSAWFNVTDTPWLLSHQVTTPGVQRHLRASVLPSDLPQCRRMSGGKILLQRPQQKHRWQSCTACSGNSTAARGGAWPGESWRSGEGTRLSLVWNHTSILSCFKQTVCSEGLEKNKRQAGTSLLPKFVKSSAQHTCTPWLSSFQMVKESHVVLYLQCLQSLSRKHLTIS